VLVVENGDAAWAWSGVRLAPAAGIDATRAYSDVPEERRWREAAEAEAAWLRGQLATAAGRGTVGPVFAVRYVNERTDGLLDAYLLWRTQGADGDSASAAASAAGRTLAAVPRHLAGAPLARPEEITRALRPFAPHASGLAEVRKALTAARTLRADAGTGVLVAIGSFAVGGRSWEPLWAQLAELPFPAMVTISLTALTVTPQTSAVFRQVADAYARLARPGPAVTAVYGRPAAPDSFAAQAATSYADMARRYVNGVFTTSITVASAQQPPPMLAETLAGLVSAPGGWPAVVLRPGPGENHTMWGVISMLNMDPLPVSALQGIPPEALPDPLRVLGALADADEAAALFRLPYEIPGHRELFRRLPAPDTEESPGDAGTMPSASGQDPWLSRFTTGGSA
jgi:hypothetical protein